ncbi:MAG: DegT/DnrJ/EryC1/StrS family aminotransferase [Marmoricola sp.]
MTEPSTPRVSAVRVHVGDEETAAVLRVLRSGRLVQGQEVAAFEEEFSALVGGRTCVAVNSGTSALHLGLLAAGIGPGDEVVVPSFTFAATANAVAMTGATPVFADIDPDTFCLDPDAVAAAVTSRTAAVIPVHLYGHPAPWDGLSGVAERHGLLLLEDAAQAHAATYDGTSVGALGDLAAFSFYATKNMTTGEGGMVSCRDEDTARRVRLLRNQGMEQRYRNEIAGLNNRMTDLAAAMGRVQLGRLAGWNEDRRAVAAAYDEQLVGVVTPFVAPKAQPVWHQYTVRATDRDALAARLDERGIDSAVYYPVPTHRLPAYDLDLDLPETERATREVLSLPIHPGLTDQEVARVVAAVNEETDHG